MLVELRLAANLCRVCINQVQKSAKDNGRVLFFPCGDKLDPDIIWLQTVEPDTWHHWQHAHGFDTSHPQCNGHDCDYYYFHTVSQFDFGQLDRYDTNPNHLLFHSPYQIAVEFDADVAELSQGWVPVSVQQSARNFGNTRLASQFVNSPAYTIGDPRPW